MAADGCGLLAQCLPVGLAGGEHGRLPLGEATARAAGAEQAEDLALGLSLIHI